MDENIKKTIEELSKNESSSKLLYGVIEEIKFSKKNLWQYIIIIIIGVFISLIISFSYRTVEVLNEYADMLNNIAIAFIAMILGSYSIFQALLTDEFLLIMAKTENNLLKIANRSFLNLIILYLIDIIISIVIIILTSVISSDWCISNNLILSNSIAFIPIVIYSVYNLLIICEIKNFAFNLYKMFNANNLARIIVLDYNEDDDEVP